MPPRHQEEPSTGAGFNNENIASGHASVGAQIATVDGDVINNVTNYTVTPDDPPEKRFEVALANLASGDPRRAETDLKELLTSRFLRPELPYYYVLSLFSDRSIGEVAGLHREYDLACRAMDGRNTEWGAAFLTLSAVISCMWRKRPWEEPDEKALQRLRRLYGALPGERQLEIKLHLEPILNGVARETLDLAAAASVQALRMKARRLDRAWMFFEARPTRPKPLDPDPIPIGLGTWLRTAAGGLSLVLGVLAPFSGLGAGALPLGMVAMAGLLASAACVFWFGLQRLSLQRRLQILDREHGMPFRKQPAVSPGHWVRTDFVVGIHRRVDIWFARLRPHASGSWTADTKGIREELKRRFVALYGNSQVTADRVDWLIRWHVERIARQWREGKLFAYRAEHQDASATTVFYRLAQAVAIVSALAMLWAWGGFAASAALLGFGVLQGIHALTIIVATLRADADARARGRLLASEEERAYQEWLLVLSDQPTDIQMGEWLDLDKAHLRNLAMQEYGLTNADVIDHAVLTERLEVENFATQRARSPGGPWRYPAYVVRVFLFTRKGVRQVEFNLDFLTGTLGRERRLGFRYDALASAHVAEDGTRRREIRDRTRTQSHEPRARHRTFHLSLVSGEVLTVKAEGVFDAESQGKDDDISLVTSGISRGLHILEVVAAEGKEWIDHEEKRRDEYYVEWDERGEYPRDSTPPDPFGMT